MLSTWAKYKIFIAEESLPYTCRVYEQIIEYSLIKKPTICRIHEQNKEYSSKKKPTICRVHEQNVEYSAMQKAYHTYI